MILKSGAAGAADADYAVNRGCQRKRWDAGWCNPCLADCYNLPMKRRPLSETNPYLRDPEQRRKALIMSVASSTAIETGASVASIVRMLEESEEEKPSTTTQGSAL